MLLPVTAAALAINRREPKRALELLEPVAYLQLKDGQAAGVEFQSILDHRGESPNSLLYPLAIWVAPVPQR
jgi:hypothetical protein